MKFTRMKEYERGKDCPHVIGSHKAKFPYAPKSILYDCGCRVQLVQVDLSLGQFIDVLFGTKPPKVQAEA